MISSLALEAAFPVAVDIAAVGTPGFVPGIVMVPSVAAMTVRMAVAQMVIEIAYHSPQII